MITELNKPSKVTSKSKIQEKKFSYQFLPEMLEEISKHDKIVFKETKLKVSYIIDIIHNLLLKYYFKKENIFNISSLILKEKYGTIYNYYINFLREINVLQLITEYKTGRNARIYKLNDSIINGKIIKYKNTDKTLIKKYRNAILAIENEDITNNNIELSIKQKLVNDLFNVQIDYDKSMFFLNSTKQDSDIYIKNKYSVECIYNKHIFYHFDCYGRMHTNFTILKSFIRKNCLLIDNEIINETDIASSQPLFLYKLIKLSNPLYIDINELNLFKSLTLNGNFYQYIMDNLNIKNKKEAKEITYKVLFGRNIKNKKDLYFENLFPSIYQFIKTYKKENNNYKILSHTLQKMESEFIFNKVIKTIMKTNLNIKIVTIHDSIIYSEKYKNIIEPIFNKLLKEEFSL